MTLSRPRIYGFILLPVFALAAAAAVWAAEYQDVPLAGQTLARLYDPGKFPALADRVAKVEEGLAQVVAVQDLQHPSVRTQQDQGIWTVYAGPVRVLSVLPKDATGANMSEKEVAEMWAANLKRLLPLVTPPAESGPEPGDTTPTAATGAAPATGTTPAETATTPPAQEPPAANPTTPPSALPSATPPATVAATVPAPSPLTQSAAVLLIVDALNTARSLPENQYLAHRQELAGNLLTKLNSFFTGEPMPPSTVTVPPPSATTPPPAPVTTVNLPPPTPSALTVPAEWHTLSPGDRLKKKFELATKPYYALEASDPTRYSQVGNLLSASRAAKAALKWEESEKYLDSALEMMGITIPPPAAGDGT